MTNYRHSAGLIVAAILIGTFLTTVRAAGQNPPPPPPPPKQVEPPTREQRIEAYLSYLEAQRLKGEAQKQRSAKLLESAISKLRETIKLDPSSAEPHVDLGELYFFYLSRRDIAEIEALQAVRLEPENVNAHMLLARLSVTAWKTENASRQQYLDRAIREYERVAELDPGRTEAWAMLSELYQNRNLIDKQIHALEKWTGAPLATDEFFYRWLMNGSLSPDNAYLQLSRLYLSKSNEDQAIEAARTAYMMDPDSNENARNLINILRAVSDRETELKVYAQLFKGQVVPVLMIGYGSSLVRAGMYDEAARQLSEYVKLDPSNASALGLLSIAQRRSGRRQQAVDTLKLGMTRVEVGTRIDLMVALAETYEELGRDEDALGEYEKALDSILSKGALTPVNTPLFSEVVTRLARVCRRNSDPARLQKAIARARQAVDEHDSLLDMLEIENLREEGKTTQALDAALAAARRYPDDRAVKFTHALILADLRKFDESTDLLNRMIRETPESRLDDASVRIILSGVLLQSGDLAGAEKAIRRSIADNPDNPDAVVQLSSVLERAGKVDEAEKVLKDLIRIDPGNATALNNLGYFLVERGNGFDEAVRLIEKAVMIEPINGSFLDSLGWAYFKAGRKTDALQTLEKALRYSRRNPTIHEHLGDVLRDMGQIDRARIQWEQAIKYSIEDDVIARIRVKLNKQ
ncbi:MAG: tetratricopeptide repeat protein [Blastocatellales bacterium]